jgi:probable F420-dependent oxidoreductase
MQFGAGFALTAGHDPAPMRDFAQALDDAGFDFVTLAGHILAAESGRYPDRPTPTYSGPFHDPFVLFAYLAGITRRLHFRTNILILPLYPTAIVAKQAAELQMLSGGRFELGVGISWSPDEYAALGQEFTTRGRRLAEQVELLRRMWSEPLVTFDGRFHHFDGLGFNRVVSPPIPIWFGATNTERPLRRVARLADGFVPLGPPAELIGKVRQYMLEYGRDPAALAFGTGLAAGPGGPDAWVEAARGLQSLGVTHITLTTPPDLPRDQALTRLIEARAALAGVLD